MPLFNSLSFVISQQFKAQSIVEDHNISLRSPVAQQMQIVNTSKSDVVQTEDVLRWGYSNWGLQKVTSEYKPRETR